MSWSFQWRPYVPVAERRARAARELAKLGKKSGQAASPVVLDGRKIAATFWGKAWCDNLERYSDFANRLPRGRSYVRNGSVVDLQISHGRVLARVAGSALYQIEVKIKPLAAARWKSLQAECAGKIDSLIELLQGRLSSSVMAVVTRPEQGLFPTPKEIELDCSCPDWADLCKHVAATLYGVGARLDEHPELLFLLRGVDPAELIGQASAAEAVRQTTDGKNVPAMSETEMADVFGIELAAAPTGVPAGTEPAARPVLSPTAPAPVKAPRQKRAARESVAAAATTAKVAGKGQAKNIRQPAKAKAGVAVRKRIAAAMRARIAAMKKPGRRQPKQRHPAA